MNLLLWGGISPVEALPDFGPDFRRHIEKKTNPQVRRASIAAWSLLAEGLRQLGLPLPEICFGRNGKPEFKNSRLHFSLSHSGELAAALLSTGPCGVDVEQLRPEVSEKLMQRCMHPEEIAAGLDFFEVWTKKECIAKLDGSGMPARPNTVNTLDGVRRNWYTESILHNGKEYRLTALCQNTEEYSLK